MTTFHDLFVLTAGYSSAEFRARFAEQARHAAAESDRIIAVSSFTARQVQELLNVEAARIRVVHHGIRRLPAAARAERNIVLSVGAIQLRKNTGRLVSAFERAAADPKYGDWKLVLAGSSGYGSGEILRQIEDSPCRSRIIVTGYVTPAQLAEWYSSAAIFAFPSLDEGFGMPVLEAMSAGVPVIAANRSALPEVSGDAALLVSPESVDEIAGALVRLMGDSGLRQSMALRGTQWASTFTWEKAVAETWKVYEELL